jgi:hypothetical protein
MNCPKCDADISDTYEWEDPSVGIVGGYYCDACDLVVGEEDRHFRKCQAKPGDLKNPNDSRHAGYAEFCRGI